MASDEDSARISKVRVVSDEVKDHRDKARVVSDEDSARINKVRVNSVRDRQVRVDLGADRKAYLGLCAA